MVHSIWGISSGSESRGGVRGAAPKGFPSPWDSFGGLIYLHSVGGSLRGSQGVGPGVSTALGQGGNGGEPLSHLPAASQSRRSGCRLSGTPVRSCPKPTTTTSGEPGASRARGGDTEGVTLTPLGSALQVRDQIPGQADRVPGHEQNDPEQRGHRAGTQPAVATG